MPPSPRAPGVDTAEENLDLTLTGRIEDVGEDGSSLRSEWKNNLKTDIAANLGISDWRCVAAGHLEIPSTCCCLLLKRLCCCSFLLLQLSAAAAFCCCCFLLLLLSAAAFCCCFLLLLLTSLHPSPLSGSWSAQCV